MTSKNMHSAKNPIYDGTDTITLDENFLSRLRGNTLTFSDVQNILTLGRGRLGSIMRSFGGTINPPSNVYHYMVQEIPTAPNIKISYVLPYVAKHIWKDVLDSLDSDSLLNVLIKMSLQSKYKQDTMALKYLELIVYGMNIILVKYLAGHYQYADIIDAVGIISYQHNLKEFRPVLYNNLNEVFNLTRWHNRQKLLNKI